MRSRDLGASQAEQKRCRVCGRLVNSTKALGPFGDTMPQQFIVTSKCFLTTLSTELSTWQNSNSLHKRKSTSKMKVPQEPKPNLTSTSNASRDEQSTQDYYFENGFLVFTAAYHLKRGSCCGSGCRHCPFEPSHVLGTKTVRQQKTA